MDVFERITELQGEFNPDSIPYMIGEQLKDICRNDPACGPILLEDLENPDMGLAAADKKLYDHGKTLAKGRGGVGISPRAAEKVLREFYGLPDAGEAPKAQPVKAAPALSGPFSLNLDDFLRGGQDG